MSICVGTSASSTNKPPIGSPSLFDLFSSSKQQELLQKHHPPQNSHPAHHHLLHHHHHFHHQNRQKMKKLNDSSDDLEDLSSNNEDEAGGSDGISLLLSKTMLQPKFLSLTTDEVDSHRRNRRHHQKLQQLYSMKPSTFFQKYFHCRYQLEMSNSIDILFDHHQNVTMDMAKIVNSNTLPSSSITETSKMTSHNNVGYPFQSDSNNNRNQYDKNSGDEGDRTKSIEKSDQFDEGQIDRWKSFPNTGTDKTSYYNSNDNNSNDDRDDRSDPRKLISCKKDCDGLTLWPETKANNEQFLSCQEILERLLETSSPTSSSSSSKFDSSLTSVYFTDEDDNNKNNNNHKIFHEENDFGRNQLRKFQQHQRNQAKQNNLPPNKLNDPSQWPLLSDQSSNMFSIDHRNDDDDDNADDDSGEGKGKENNNDYLRRKASRYCSSEGVWDQKANYSECGFDLDKLVSD